MNAVSGGPTAKFRGNQDDWRHARIPFGRTHDMNYDYTFGGPHTIDIAAKLANDYGQQVKAQVVGDDQLYAVAARNPDGALAVWISRYSNDNNVLDDRDVRVVLPSAFATRRLSCHLTDDIHAYTEVTLDRDAKDGAILLKLVPNSFVLLEVR